MELLGLIHIDICGLFPVQGPRSEQYFIIALDDHSHDAVVECLRTRDQAFSFYVAVEVQWECQTGKKVKVVHLDGAKELVEGRMGNHFESRGILLQQTAAYSHQQNGKAERFVCTIEDTTRALVMGSDLPVILAICKINCSISSSSSTHFCSPQ